MNSKFGNLAKPAPQLLDNEMVLKQLNLNKLSDAGSPKDMDVRRSQKPNFEFICVYSWFFKDFAKKIQKEHILGNFKRGEYLCHLLMF